jgi:acetyl esterase
MTLDPQSAWVLELVEKAGNPTLDSLDVPDARALFEDTAWRLDFEPVEMARIDALEIPVAGGATIAARAYTPKGLAADGAPALVYFHGGGWVVGSLDTHDRLCRKLAAEVPCKVVSVAYRLAPEHPFPTPVEDAVAAFRWIAGEAGPLGSDPARIAVGGDSAGGNLSAVLCQTVRDAGDALQPCFQLLLYPATDFAGDYASREANAEGYMLTKSLIGYFSGHYLDGWREPEDPRLSPLRATSLEDLPPALVITAGYDPLQGEGVAYADAMKAAGVPVAYRDYPGMLHGFFNFGGAVDVAARAVGEAAVDLRRAFGTS